jgi:glycosyltransferase involved in cell wall biosynthesis
VSYSGDGRGEGDGRGHEHGQGEGHGDGEGDGHGDAAIDAGVLRALAGAYGERAVRLPPVALVIAAYNEEGAVGPVVAALPRTVCGLAAEVIVIADGCVDATVKEAREAGALVADVPVNRGQGAALRLGYRIAREGGARYIVTTDADGQYDPREIESLLAPVVAGRADFVTGSRRLGRAEGGDPIRGAGVRFFAVLVSMLTGQRISDTTFGLRAMRAEVTGTVRLEQPQYQASELLISVIAHGYRVLELPATMRRRTVGASKKGQNALYHLNLPAVNDLCYGGRFTRVVLSTWWRERRRAALAGYPRRRGAACPAAWVPPWVLPGLLPEGGWREWRSYASVLDDGFDSVKRPACPGLRRAGGRARRGR